VLIILRGFAMLLGSSYLLEDFSYIRLKFFSLLAILPFGGTLPRRGNAAVLVEYGLWSQMVKVKIQVLCDFQQAT
jgi:hypothetical protein